ncbi:flippase-like domain-containing protein [Acetobacter vaccinii]|uniref:Flippase-like domain-containing protein n=1 Tax=Acetobacter vaccinii TaxID=2592655 RepID=A0A5C1YQC2_9PROT|nr:flippase-like domain-containing protein [Acetobacter vaccinii]QEO17913.1 flippase-like domain-containing protein [Acetobacter vaccinii]
MKSITLAAGVIGLGLTVWMLEQFGACSILDLVMAGGWGLAAAICFHAVQVALSAQAWRIMSNGPDGAAVPSLRDYSLLRCVREGINNLLPVAQVGGEVLSTRLLARRGLGGRRAAAATICDLTMELFSQALFTVAGLGLLLFLVKRSTVTDRLVESAAVLLAVGICVVASQWLGAVAVAEKLMVRIAGHLGWNGANGIRGLHGEVMALYKTDHNAVTCLTLQFFAWILGAVEVCLLLHAMGHGCSLAQGFVIEGVGQAAKSAGFAVPGALGVSEGGYIMVGSLFGMPPSVALALSLLKRLREIAWGVPSLILWQWLEHSWRAEARTAEKSPLPTSSL